MPSKPSANPLQTVRKRVSEIIGRVSAGFNLWSQMGYTMSTVDLTIPDYNHWDRFRRGMITGQRLAGLFAKPAAEIKADWIIGDGFTAQLALDDESDAVEYTNGLIARFAARVKGPLITMVQDLKSLGDQYVIVNPDGSISIPSPETVRLEYNKLDYREAVKATVLTRTDKMTVTDEYRADGRTMMIKTDDKDLLAQLVSEGWEIIKDGVKKEFENLIGRLPIVHFSNDRSANETHGRPQHEGLRYLFERYDAQLSNGLDAAEIMGHPVPKFTGLSDVGAMLDANAEPTAESWTDTDGTTRSRTQLSFDRFATILLYGDEDFEFVAPPTGFTNDVKAMLKLLFLLILENLRIPEVVWGGELGQARASAGETMKTFYKHITGQRLALEGMPADELLGADAQGGIHELIDIWLRFRSLVDRKVMVAPVRVDWPTLNEANDEMNLKWADGMHNKGIITDERYVAMSGRVDDPESEVAAAKTEMVKRQDSFDQSVDNALDNADATATPAAA
jgi:hypothetical protein